MLIRVQLFHTLSVLDELFVAFDCNLHRHILVVGLNLLGEDLHELVDAVQSVVCVHCDAKNVRLHIQITLDNGDALVF